MYHYIIDQSRLPIRTFDRLLGEVYGYLTEYQINGEVHRVTRLRNVNELVESTLASGARTIVAVGDDHLFLQLLDILHTEPNVVLGYVPLVNDSEVGRILGLGGLADACKAIAQRRVAEFDLGQINRHHFFTNVNFGSFTNVGPDAKLSTWSILTKALAMPTLPVKIRVDDNYDITAKIMSGLVVNARIPGLCESDLNISPHDGKLDLLLVGALSRKDLMKYKKEFSNGCFEVLPSATVIHGTSFEIEGPKAMSINLGPLQVSRFPAYVGLSESTLRVIIGKGKEL